MIFPLGKVFDFIATQMSYQRVIVVSTDDLYSNSFWYKW